MWVCILDWHGSSRIACNTRRLESRYPLYNVIEHVQVILGGILLAAQNMDNPKIKYVDNHRTAQPKRVEEGDLAIFPIQNMKFDST